MYVNGVPVDGRDMAANPAPLDTDGCDNIDETELKDESDNTYACSVGGCIGVRDDSDALEDEPFPSAFFAQY